MNLYVTSDSEIIYHYVSTNGVHASLTDKSTTLRIYETANHTTSSFEKAPKELKLCNSSCKENLDALDTQTSY